MCGCGDGMLCATHARELQKWITVLENQLAETRLCVFDLSNEAENLLSRESAGEHMTVGFHAGVWKAWDSEYAEHGHVRLTPRKPVGA